MSKLSFDKYKDYLYIIIGTILIAVSVVCFFEPQGLVTGGVTGLAIIIASVGKSMYGVEIPLWATNLVLNVPLFLLGLKIRGKDFLARTMFSTVFLSIALSWAAKLPAINAESDMVVYTVFGAVLSGIGAGFVFRAKATTGGSDLFASIIHYYMRHISIAKILLVVDAAILVLGFFVFGARSSMYAIIAIYIVSQATDAILEGFDFAKAAFIISDKEKEIAKEFMDITERGATFIKASGVYTGKEKEMLMIVMSNKEIIIMKDIIKRIDPAAFIIVTDVREVLGEGFREIA